MEPEPDPPHLHPATTGHAATSAEGAGTGRGGHARGDAVLVVATAGLWDAIGDQVTGRDHTEGSATWPLSAWLAFGGNFDPPQNPTAKSVLDGLPFCYFGVFLLV